MVVGYSVCSLVSLFPLLLARQADINKNLGKPKMRNVVKKNRKKLYVVWWRRQRWQCKMIMMTTTILSDGQFSKKDFLVQWISAFHVVVIIFCLLATLTVLHVHSSSSSSSFHTSVCRLRACTTLPFLVYIYSLFSYWIDGDPLPSHHRWWS